MKMRLKIRRFFNGLWNQHYIASRHIRDATPVRVQSFNTRSHNKIHARAFEPVWLNDIDKLIATDRTKTSDYHFLDVGCGKGISTIYVKERYFFKSVTGFDFEPDFIEAAERNLKYSTVKGPIDFYIGDAGDWLLDDQRWFLFLYNPFSDHVLEQFLRNNIDVLRKTQSVLAYANAQELETVLDFPHEMVYRLPHIRSALILF
jgi:SAM-dependent methyltransferase